MHATEQDTKQIIRDKGQHKFISQTDFSLLHKDLAEGIFQQQVITDSNVFMYLYVSWACELTLATNVQQLI
jgi:hypothetical protein